MDTTPGIRSECLYAMVSAVFSGSVMERVARVPASPSTCDRRYQTPRELEDTLSFR